MIAPFDGVPTLMFRVANQRGNQIMEAEVSVSLARQHVTREGHVMRRFDELRLVRSKTPLFYLSWTVMHPITEESPLHGATRESLIAQQAEIILNEKDAHAAYSNFARVTSTAEEVIIDFCLNPNPHLNLGPSRSPDSTFCLSRHFHLSPPVPRGGARALPPLAQASAR